MKQYSPLCHYAYTYQGFVCGYIDDLLLIPVRPSQPHSMVNNGKHKCYISLWPLGLCACVWWLLLTFQALESVPVFWCWCVPYRDFPNDISRLAIGFPFLWLLIKFNNNTISRTVVQLSIKTGGHMMWSILAWKAVSTMEVVKNDDPANCTSGPARSLEEHGM